MAVDFDHLRAAVAGAVIAPDDAGWDAARAAAGLGSLAGTALIRTARMNDVAVDPGEGTALTGAGARWSDVIEVVTAGGERRQVDARREPDLFWALRGGGGAGAIVTAIELELVELREAFAGALLWPLARAGEVAHAYGSGSGPCRTP